MITAAQTNPDKIAFTEEKFKKIALEDELTDKTFVILDNGNMYLPKVTVADKTSTEFIVKVGDVMAFSGITFLIIFVIVVALYNLVFKKESNPPTFNPAMFNPATFRVP